jgi:hypothetical protein
MDEVFGTHSATTRGAASDTISALFQVPTAPPAQPGDHHSERRDQPKLTVCTSGKSHPQNPRRREAGRASR